MPVTDCLVFEQWGEWATALRQLWTRSASVGPSAESRPVDRGSSLPHTTKLLATANREWTSTQTGNGRVIEIRDWEGLREALVSSPTSLVCLDTPFISPAQWLTRWPAIEESFPLTRTVVLSRFEDRAMETAFRDAGVIEVIRGRGDLACLAVLFSRQRARYPEPPVTWRSAIEQRLPWGAENVEPATHE